MLFYSARAICIKNQMKVGTRIMVDVIICVMLGGGTP